MDENASDPIMPNVLPLSPLSEVNLCVDEDIANYEPEIELIELVENEIEGGFDLCDVPVTTDSNLDQPIHANREIAPIGSRSRHKPRCVVCLNYGTMKNCYAQQGFSRSICPGCKQKFKYFITHQLRKDANGTVIVPECTGEDCWSQDKLDKLDKRIIGKGEKYKSKERWCCKAAVFRHFHFDLFYTGRGSANESGNKEPCSNAQAMAQLQPPLKSCSFGKYLKKMINLGSANEIGEMVAQQDKGGFTADDLIEGMDELDLEYRKGHECKFPYYAIYDWQKCECNRRLSKPSPPIDGFLRMPWMEDRTHHFSNFLTKHGLHPPREAVVARGAVICKKYRFIMATDLLTWFVENNTLFEEVPPESLSEHPDRNYFIFCTHRKTKNESEIFYGTDGRCLAGYGPFIMFQHSRRYFYCKRFEQLRKGNPVLDAQLQYETIRQQFTNSCVCGDEKDWGTLNGVHCLMNWAIVSGKQFGPLRRQIHALTPQQMQMPLENNKPLIHCGMGRLQKAAQFCKYFLKDKSEHIQLNQLSYFTTRNRMLYEKGHGSAPELSLGLTEHDEPPSPLSNCFIYCEMDSDCLGIFYGTDEHCVAGASNWAEFKKLRKYYY